MLELHTVGYIFHYDIICYSAVNRFQTEQSDRQILYPWATWEALWFLCFSAKNLLWNFLLIPIKTHTHLVFSFLSSQVSVRQYSQSNVSRLFFTAENYCSFQTPGSSYFFHLYFFQVQVWIVWVCCLSPIKLPELYLEDRIMLMLHNTQGETCFLWGLS